MQAVWKVSGHGTFVPENESLSDPFWEVAACVEVVCFLASSEIVFRLHPRDFLGNLKFQSSRASATGSGPGGENAPQNA